MGTAGADRIAVLGLLVVVGVGYFTMLTALPLHGEETRWARVAIEMRETGDWIVPRQQGEPFLDRPPLGAWAMAGVGVLRGEVDQIAIRLPSALAILVTTLLIFWCVRRTLPLLGAFAAAVTYPCFGQVLQIGWTGESEALYTLLVSAALLVWYSMYTSGRRVFVVWSVGSGLAALATLVKGPQALMYFMMATTAYLVWRRDWRWLLSVGAVLGVGVGCLVPALWVAALLQRLGSGAVRDVLLTLALSKYGVDTLLLQIAVYPVLVWGSLLPGSIVWLSLLTSARRALGPAPEVVRFSVIALLVTFPTVWFAEHARPRHFMPLFPCAAVLVGWTVQRLAGAPSSSPGRRWWNLSVMGGAFAVAGFGLVLLAAVFGADMWGVGREVGVYAAACIGVSAVLVRSARTGGVRHAAAALGAIAVFQLIVFRGVVTEALGRGARDMAPVVIAVRDELPVGARLVSIGPVHHRFAYHYRTLIPRVRLSTTTAAAPVDLEFFCFESVRGSEPAGLPELWIQVARVVNDSELAAVPESVTVIGRILRQTPARRE